MSRRRNVTILLVIIVAVIIIGYSLFNSRLLIIGPSITIFEPENGSVFDNPFIEIVGKAENTAFISLDDNPIFVDESGNFREKLLLPSGTSIIKLYAHDRFGRELETLLTLTYSGESIEIDTSNLNFDVATSSPATTTEPKSS